ncbi:LamG-like jellyroll fold domain-containing protein [Pseudokineococcus lusitanus]|uniref:Ig-like protein group 4 n=1 Tax=Pseudokineococcus lusitanus TaxID=763993 RepID=A0A3N1G8K0_9ACTN|nr:LamG-like jellyroll fold domain-containing protein [Pseudokineococcus lusitanus]ROP26553.1 Ig-like protein group 4 [Pseudokineococcus lusitanus]
MVIPTAGATTAATRPAPAPAPAAAAETPELVLHYTFDDVDLAGGVVPDSSAKGLDGQLRGAGGATVVEGAAGTALELPGGTPGTDSPFVEIPGGVFEGLEAATISTWVRWDGGPDFQWVYNLGANNERATFLTPSFSGDARTRSSVKPVNGNAEVGVSGGSKLPTGSWVQATTVLDGSTVVYYVNGLEVGRQSAALDLDAVLHADGTSGRIGRAFWEGHPFFDGAVDDFQVFDAAMSPEQVVELYGQDLPTVSGLATSTFDVRTTRSVAPTLPRTVDATYSDGLSRPVAITWADVPADAYAQPGRFTVEGRVAGTEQTVTATVVVTLPGEVTVDLATSTGAFLGGASGTLYGVYDEGLPTRNLLEGIDLQSVATKAQDGPQHPGADALEVVEPLAATSDGDVYVYMTDIHRGFPYQWPGDTPEQRMDIYMEKLEKQVDQVLQLPEDEQDNIVLMPFNEPEGNMFGSGQWSYNGISWLDDPQYFFASWDRAYRMIKDKWPEARISGPNTSVLYDQVHGFMEHAVAADTVPEVISWHELSNPATIRTSVDRYRGWEEEIFAGTEREGTELPINITEYAFNYHTSVPGQMIQWVSALEDSKVFGDIAYWNIDGNLSDSAVEANKANGQWWLLNAYSSMSGDTVELTPPQPGVSYTLQGVASLDEEKGQARAIIGGAEGESFLRFDNVPADVFGETVHVEVKEIGWTGQLGSSANPPTVAEYVAEVQDGELVVHFGGEEVPLLDDESAYQVVVSPGEGATATSSNPVLWDATYEAEDATRRGAGITVNGPEGGPTRQGSFYTSGEYNVGGLRTGADVSLDFEVDVPQAGEYDLSVFANSLNTAQINAEQGPVNVFLRVDGRAASEQELFMPLGYKWVVWDQEKTTVQLPAGRSAITLASRSADGTGSTKGDVLIDKIDLSLANPAHTEETYEAEQARLDDGATLDHTGQSSGAGKARLGADQAVTFWVHSPVDAGATLALDATSDGTHTVTVNENEVSTGTEVTTFLSGGINKVTVTGVSGTTLVDRLRVTWPDDALPSTEHEAEDATLAGTARVADMSLASGGKAVVDVGGAPGNGSTLTFDDVVAAEDGKHALTFRYSNQEQSPATHYNPDPVARYAYISVNGGEAQRVPFPHSFHQNNFWELTVPVELTEGTNTVRISSEEKPNFDGVTYASDTWPGILLRSEWAPNLDTLRVTPLVASDAEPEPQLDVAVAVESRCVGRNTFLQVTMTNDEDARVAFTATSPHGQVTVPQLAPDRTTGRAIRPRATSVPAGEVTWTATKGDVVATGTAAYAAKSCR